ncbi:MAG: sigma-70 family RNA polymerase sigma factor [Lachnospiraceae bacterium]|nr:sigma-70 family RNA polymerase sigma factor [Lachnospiraceae bacterium]
MKDNEIIDLYWNRDEQAITESQNAYGAYCFSIADNILRDYEDAEECVNDTWFRTWNLIPPQKPTYLALFLGKITRNLSFDRWRKKHAKKRIKGEMQTVLDELAECIPSALDVEQEIMTKELGSIINRFLGTLKERDREIFLRRYFYVESVSVIAMHYDFKESYVLVILSRVRKNLEKVLRKEGYRL